MVIFVDLGPGVDEREAGVDFVFALGMSEIRWPAADGGARGGGGVTDFVGCTGGRRGLDEDAACDT